VTSIILADDHASIRRFIKRLLKEEEDLCVVGEAGNGLDAAQMVADLKPDILITDLSMPGLDGIEVTQRVRKSSPQTMVIVLSMWDPGKYAEAAKKAGAIAYMVKDSAIKSLVPAIRAAMDRQRNGNSQLPESAPAMPPLDAEKGDFE
jgi:two-component system, NarL family, invasion response regulator UvrY